MANRIDVELLKKGNRDGWHTALDIELEEQRRALDLMAGGFNRRR